MRYVMKDITMDISTCVMENMHCIKHDCNESKPCESFGCPHCANNKRYWVASATMDDKLIPKTKKVKRHLQEIMDDADKYTWGSPLIPNIELEEVR